MNQNLQNWLETATQNLAPAAKARVCEQLLEHHAAALEQHQPKPNAEALALADLGNAEDAAKKFEQAYLTAREWQQLAEIHAHSKKQSLVVGFVLLGVLLLVGLTEGNNSGVFLEVGFYSLSQEFYWGLWQQGLVA
jgi:hypothetical protein